MSKRSEPIGLSHLLNSHAGPGRVDWIGLRPVRREPVVAVAQADITETGLVGDHRARPGKRALSLVQAEHLPVIAALARRDDVRPEQLRRNIVISGMNLVALRHKTLRLGGAVIRLTGLCAPCSRMETELGQGGYNAMRGHGGWTAEVLEAGSLALGDTVTVLD